MADKKKYHPPTIERLTRKPQNDLDARVLSMKIKACQKALKRNGAAALPAPPSGSGNVTMDHVPFVGNIPMDQDTEDDDEEAVQPVAPLEDPTRDPPDPRLDGYDNIAQDPNRGFYSGRRAHEEVQWRTRHPAMFPIFLKMQQLTKDWSNPQTFNYDHKKDCNCQGTPRTLDVLDLCTPDQPVSAISIRLLRFFHILWKFCSIAFQPFALALAEFLDPGNPIFLAKGGEKAREWHRTLSAAMDAYRQMLIMTDTSVSKALRLTDYDELGFKCPQCFGPDVDPLPDGEPCHCVCLDGNFQHRRHLAASVELGGVITPAMFLPPEEVEKMRDSVPVARPQKASKTHWAEAEVVSCV
ncbi:hypothetical protein DFH28DRAFT_909511 [Melampsora americana]|nr:hypothetical protein DFH28DRAFT_909511 [Melampsora americana]